MILKLETHQIHSAWLSSGGFRLANASGLACILFSRATFSGVKGEPKGPSFIAVPLAHLAFLPARLHLGLIMLECLECFLVVALAALLRIALKMLGMQLLRRV